MFDCSVQLARQIYPPPDMTLRTSFFFLLTFGSASLLSAKPNVIVILTDDLGYADLGCQAKEPDVRTPHLDRFAKEGVRFTSGYVTAPQCSPSRAGLMTGRQQQRFGFDTIPDGPLPLTEVTMAEMLKPAGYITKPFDTGELRSVIEATFQN